MKKETTLNGKKFTYTLKKNRRAKGVRIIIHRDASLVVTAPRGFFAERAAEKFVLGKADWIVSKINHLKQFKENHSPEFTKADYLRRKEEALKFVQDKVSHFNQIYNLKFNRISIRNQKSRWGSCSRKGNLNFNYRILFLPQNQADYIIVHELCHLGELNHSSKFWNLVAKTLSNYKEIRTELKNLEMKLN